MGEIFFKNVILYNTCQGGEGAVLLNMNSTENWQTHVEMKGNILEADGDVNPIIVLQGSRP